MKIYFSVDLTNGQLTPNNNTPLLTQALSGEVMLGIYTFFVFVFLFNLFYGIYILCILYLLCVCSNK